MRWEDGTVVWDKVGMGVDGCLCKQSPTGHTWTVNGNCPHHGAGNEQSPVQLTVGAYYYEGGMRSHVPSFYHPRCLCVGSSDESERASFQVVPACPMHNPGGQTRPAEFPVSKTVMK